MKWNKKVLRKLRNQLGTRKSRKHSTKRTHNQKNSSAADLTRPRVLLAALKQKWRRENNVRD